MIIYKDRRHIDSIKIIHTNKLESDLGPLKWKARQQTSSDLNDGEIKGPNKT